MGRQLVNLHLPAKDHMVLQIQLTHHVLELLQTIAHPQNGQSDVGNYLLYLFDGFNRHVQTMPPSYRAMVD